MRLTMQTFSRISIPVKSDWYWKDVSLFTVSMICFTHISSSNHRKTPKPGKGLHISGSGTFHRAPGCSYTPFIKHTTLSPRLVFCNTRHTFRIFLKNMRRYKTKHLSKKISCYSVTPEKITPFKKSTLLKKRIRRTDGEKQSPTEF